MIKITVTKTVDIDGKKQVSLKITGMKHRNDLPEEYYTRGSGVYAFYNPSYTTKPVTLSAAPENPKEYEHEYRTDLPMDQETAELIIRHIQEAGDRLHKINQRIERERAMYAGSHEITI